MPWHGTKLVEVETRVAWAKTRTWKGMHPLVELRRKVDQKGVTLSKQAMRAVADRLQRHPELPQWDMLIRPVSTSSCRIFFLRNRLRGSPGGCHLQNPGDGGYGAAAAQSRTVVFQKPVADWLDAPSSHHSP